MGVSKTEKFSEEQNKLATIAKAIGHPARVAIIEHLLKVDSCICKDITNELPLAQPTISQHLKELRKVDLIKGTVEGNAICYCLNLETFEYLNTYFFNIIEKIKPLNDNNCC